MSDIDNLIGRRQARRQSVEIMGTLLTPSRTQPVLIKDVSATGAKILVRRPVRDKTGLLAWEDRKVWCEVVWVDGLMLGLHFLEAQAVEEDDF
ncbi:hypothetical protein EH30_15555 [Erythrobacter sp. JL475]|nr:hypothetical protein EH30_15555 [Erythrobacter sp. JL475]